jgi:catechol 2,3-dioxygenase-like lactoylglutathione lyase family enzyme
MEWIGLAHVQLVLPAGGEAEARRFYGEVLDLEEIEKPENLKARGGCWFRVGSHEIHLGVEESTPRSRRHPAFVLKNLGDLRARLEAAGAEVQDDEPLPGYHRFYAWDPFGNRLEFLEHASTL